MVINNYALEKRIKDLPQPAYQALRKELESKGNTRFRVDRIISGKKMYAEDCETLCSFIGCTIQQLLNPEESLVYIYVMKEKSLQKTKSLSGLTKVA